MIAVGIPRIIPKKFNDNDYICDQVAKMLESYREFAGEVAPKELDEVIDENTGSSEVDDILQKLIQKHMKHPKRQIAGPIKAFKGGRMGVSLSDFSAYLSAIYSDIFPNWQHQRDWE